MLRSFFETYWRDVDGEVVLIALAIIVPLELIWPLRRIPFKQRLPHLLFVLLTGPAILLGFRALLSAAFGVDFHDGQWMSFGTLPKPGWGFLPTLDLGTWIRRSPFPAATFAFLTLFLGELGSYWWHRAMHTIPFLWPIHKLHHMDQNLNVFSTTVNHPIEFPVASFFSGWIAAYLIRCAGGEPDIVGVMDGAVFFVITRRLQGWLIHSNLKVSFGPFTKVFMGPQVHRIHHSIEPEHQNKNFATFFPIWDILFGTYYHPSKDEWPKTGIAGEEATPLRPLEAFMVPFQAWKKTLSLPTSKRSELAR
jgi:sterol desaturase/sphingolipid hydroxylase (fatty acid hydroxylase superfamily)